MKCLNLGCGRRFHADWINVDFASADERVVAHDLRRGVPFPDDSFDLVYHSHVLEHFAKTDAEWFLSECLRVLGPRGVLRVAVPDLERIARLYLSLLDGPNLDSRGPLSNYEWILIELYDQAVRNHTGGEWAKYLSNPRLDNEEFVIARCGSEARNVIDAFRRQRESSIHDESARGGKLSWIARRIRNILINPSSIREAVIERLLGQDYENLQVGRFRRSGEVHQWMYDRFSLSRLLQEVGFEGVIQRTAVESYVPNWSTFNLDTESDGTVCKPDSLFMEAIKPA
jgi:hypothetical protein